MLNKRQVVLEVAGFLLFCFVGILLFTAAGKVREHYSNTQEISPAVRTEEFASKFGVGKQYKFQPAQTTSLITYWSNITYVNLNLDCSVFTPNMFVLSVANALALDPSSIRVVDMICGSMTVFFQCAAATTGTAVTSYIDAANAQCSNVKYQVEYQGSTLYNLLSTTKPQQYIDDGTCNNGIFALYVLILLPIICCAGCILWYRIKQSQADSQYLQDTATFSKVAARQPQQPYDPTAPIYQPSVVAQPPPPMPVMQPIMQAPPQQSYVPPPVFNAPQYAPTFPAYNLPPQYAAPPQQPGFYQQV